MMPMPKCATLSECNDLCGENWPHALWRQLLACVGEVFISVGGTVNCAA
jgi:hypothetical protein